MVNTFTFHFDNYILKKKTMYHLSQLQASILLFSTISIYHIVMLMILYIIQQLLSRVNFG